MIKKDFTFDTNIIKKHVYTDNYNVDYYMYNDDSKKDTKYVWVPNDPQNCTDSIQIHGACFSEFIEHYLKHQSVNRLYYKVDSIPIENYDNKFEETMEDYIKLCVKYKLLPKYTNIDESIKNQVFVIKLDESLIVKHTYVYLCMARFIKEQPNFVKALVYLVNTVGMNIYAAIVTASATTISESVHNFIITIAPYVVPSNYVNEEALIPLKTIVGLKWFLEKPELVGINSEVFKRSKYINDRGYRTGNFIENILQGECSRFCTPKELLKKNIISVINSKDATILKQRLEACFKTDKGKKAIKKPMLKKKKGVKI